MKYFQHCFVNIEIYKNNYAKHILIYEYLCNKNRLINYHNEKLILISGDIWKMKIYALYLLIQIILYMIFIDYF